MNKYFVTIVAIIASQIFAYYASADGFSKERYIDAMQIAVGAYTPERLDDYISRVESNCISEHGFGRLTANIGILLAHGRCTELKETFAHMMDLCVRDIPRARSIHDGAGNDFSVREICCCIVALEEAHVFKKEVTDAWREGLVSMKAEDIYTSQPAPGARSGSNWCVYGSASECARIWAGIGGDRAFPDRYLGDQVNYFDENGMYRDPQEPMVYDVVTRLQFMAALYFGYDGPARKAIEDNLIKSAFHTLNFQSVTGELPYGGRSNQFLFNETFLASVFEFYATWFKRHGDMHSASRFKAAAGRAMEYLEYWTSQPSLRHVKNRFPTETGYGCESYAYFDKYMVTMGSFAYLGYLFADDTIKPAAKHEKPSVFVTGPDFHRIFLNKGGYSLEFDIDAQESYDSDGIGRFQKKGASPVIAISSPCPAGKSSYNIDIETIGGLAIAPLWEKYEIMKAVKGKVVLTDGSAVWKTTLGRKGVKMVVKGDGEQTLTLPALEFDGESSPETTCDGRNIVIQFKGDVCRYSTNGAITDTGLTYANRNGHIHRYDVKAERKLVVRGRIEEMDK